MVDDTKQLSQDTLLLRNLLSQKDAHPHGPSRSTLPIQVNPRAIDSPFASLINRLPQAKELFIAAGALLGPAGYLVTARYFAPYGVMPPLEFHLKYIVNGIAFMLFCAIFVVPIRYAIDIIAQRPMSTSPLTILSQLIAYTKEVIGSIIVIVIALVSLTGPTSMLPRGTTTGYVGFVNIAKQSLASSGLAFLVFTSVLLFRQRRNIRAILFKKENRQPLFLTALAAVATLLILSCFTMLFMIMLDVNILWLFFNALVITIQFLFLPLLIYVLTVLALFFTRMIVYYNSQTGLIPLPKQRGLPSVDNWLQRYAGAVGSWSVAIALLLSFYSLNIYPALPQAIGGGSANRLTVLVDDTNIYKQELTNSDTEVFILFRTKEKLFLRLDRIKDGTSKIIELPNADVKGISYDLLIP